MALKWCLPTKTKEPRKIYLSMKWRVTLFFFQFAQKSFFSWIEHQFSTKQQQVIEWILQFQVIPKPVGNERRSSRPNPKTVAKLSQKQQTKKKCATVRSAHSPFSFSHHYKYTKQIVHCLLCKYKWTNRQNEWNSELSWFFFCSKFPSHLIFHDEYWG